jgi:hypothetical protein
VIAEGNQNTENALIESFLSNLFGPKIDIGREYGIAKRIIAGSKILPELVDHQISLFDKILKNYPNPDTNGLTVHMVNTFKQARNTLASYDGSCPKCHGTGVCQETDLKAPKGFKYMDICPKCKKYTTAFQAIKDGAFGDNWLITDVGHNRKSIRVKI